MIVEELSSVEQAARFAFAHYPLPHQFDAADTRLRHHYTDAELRSSIDQYHAELGEDALELVPVRFNAERLEIEESPVNPSQ